MRIVLLTEAYLPITNGVVHVVKLTHDELVRRGHNVSVIAPAPVGVRVRARGVHYVPGVPLPGGSGYQLALPQLSTTHQLLKNATIIHTHHPFTLGRWGLKHAKRLGKPFLFTNHTQYVQYSHHVPIVGSLLRTPIEDTVRQFANQCTVVIAPAPTTADALRNAKVEAPIQTVPNGIEVAHFANGDPLTLRKELSLDVREPVLVYTGRLAPEKSVEQLIKLTKQLQKTLPVHLVLAGDGSSRRALTRLSHELGITDRVHFLGVVPYRRLPDIYAAGTLFVTASTSEVHPLTVLEAQAAGLPVVAVRANGTRDIITDQKNGILTPPTLTGLSAGTRQLLTRPALRHKLSRAAQANAQRYSTKASVDTLLDTYALARRLAGEH